MYLAKLITRNERNLVEAARAILGQSQGEFTRTLLLKESVVILQKAQALTRQQEEVTNAATKPSNTERPSEDAPGRSDVDSDALAKP